MDYFRAFWTGGLICALVQILLDKTRLMPGRVMVASGMQRCLVQCPGYLSAFHRIRRCRSLCPPSRLRQCPLERHKRSS